MQEQSQIQRDTKRRRWVGYIARTYRDTISGADTGWTIVKGGLVIGLGATGTVAVSAVLGPFAPLILVGAGVGALVYIGAGIKDEMDRNKEEKQAIAKLDLLNKQLASVETQVRNQLQNRLSNSNAQQDAFEQQLADIDLSSQPTSTLLTLTLARYFRRLGLLQEGVHVYQLANRMRQKNGRLPGQEGMLQLIESITGFNRKDPKFPAKLRAYFAKQGCPAQFVTTLAIAFDINQAKMAEHVDIEPKPTPKGLAARAVDFVKSKINWIARGNTAFGLIAGCIVLSVFPGSWPILLGGAIFGALSGTASLIYKNYVEKSYNKNTQNIAKELQDKSDRFKLLYKFNRLNDKNYRPLDVYEPKQELSLERILDGDDAYGLLDDYKPKSKATDQVPTSTRARIIATSIGQTLFGASVGGVIGVSAMTILGFVLGVTFPALGIPLLALTAYGAVAGGVLGLRYAYAFGKASRDAGSAEMTQIVKLARQQEQLEEAYEQDRVQELLAKSKQQLVLQLMTTYANGNLVQDTASIMRSTENDRHDGSNVANQDQHADILQRKEKVLRAIEAATGITRALDPETGYPVNSDAEFYNKLSLFLQEHRKTELEANFFVTRFKSSILQKPHTDCTVYQERPGLLQRAWTGLKLSVVNRWNLKHVLPILGTLSVALPFGFALFGPALIIPAAIAATAVVGLMVFNKVMDYRAAKNKEKLDDLAKKLPLTQAVIKMSEKAPRKRPANAASLEACKAAAQTDVAPGLQQAAVAGSRAASPSLKRMPSFFEGAKEAPAVNPDAISAGVLSEKARDQKVSGVVADDPLAAHFVGGKRSVTPELQVIAAPVSEKVVIERIEAVNTSVEQSSLVH